MVDQFISPPQASVVFSPDREDDSSQPMALWEQNQIKLALGAHCHWYVIGMPWAGSGVNESITVEGRQMQQQKLVQRREQEAFRAESCSCGGHSQGDGGGRWWAMGMSKFPPGLRSFTQWYKDKKKMT